MHPPRRWRVVGTALAISAALAGSAATSGHLDDCQTGLVDAPVEAVPLPPGWAWGGLEVGADGWQGSASWTGGDLRKATFTLACSAEPTALLQRRAEVREVLWFERLEVEEDIGEEAHAWRGGTDGRQHLEWRSRSVVGTISGEWNANLGELVFIAQGIDAVLP